MRGVDQTSDVEQCHTLGVQAGVQVVGDLLRRPTPSEVVTHVVRLGDECLFRLRGQVRPTARNCARYASSWGVAAAMPALLANARATMIGTAIPTGLRGEGI